MHYFQIHNWLCQLAFNLHCVLNTFLLLLLYGCNYILLANEIYANSLARLKNSYLNLSTFFGHFTVRINSTPNVWLFFVYHIYKLLRSFPHSAKLSPARSGRHQQKKHAVPLIYKKILEPGTLTEDILLWPLSNLGSLRIVYVWLNKPHRHITTAFWLLHTTLVCGLNGRPAHNANVLNGTRSLWSI